MCWAAQVRSDLGAEAAAAVRADAEANARQHLEVRGAGSDGGEGRQAIWGAGLEGGGGLRGCTPRWLLRHSRRLRQQWTRQRRVGACLPQLPLGCGTRWQHRQRMEQLRSQNALRAPQAAMAESGRTEEQRRALRGALKQQLAHMAALSAAAEAERKEQAELLARIKAMEEKVGRGGVRGSGWMGMWCEQLAPRVAGGARHAWRV